MTFEDLIVRVAETLKFASYTNPNDTNNNRAGVPTNPHDLDRCQRAINDGVSLLTRDYPHRGGWRCLLPIVTVTLSTDGSGPSNINGDPGRYRLPWYVQGAPIGGWNWHDGSGALGGTLVNTHLDHVRRLLLTRGTTSGLPRLAAVSPIESSDDSDRGGWELHLFPKPGGTYVLEGQFRVTPRKMVRLDEKHVFGALHDQTVVAASRFAALKSDKAMTPELVATFEADYLGSLAASVKLDTEQEPRRLGELHDPSVEEYGRWRDQSRGTPTMDGVPI